MHGKPPLAKLMKKVSVPNFDHTYNKDMERDVKRVERKQRNKQILRSIDGFNSLLTIETGLKSGSEKFNAEVQRQFSEAKGIELDMDIIDDDPAQVSEEVIKSPMINTLIDNRF